MFFVADDSLHDARSALPPVSSEVTPYPLKKSDMAILISTVGGGFSKRNVFIPTLAKELIRSEAVDDIHEIFLRTHAKMNLVAKDQTPRYETTMAFKLNLGMIFKREDKGKNSPSVARERNTHKLLEGPNSKTATCIIQ